MVPAWSTWLHGRSAWLCVVSLHGVVAWLHGCMAAWYVGVVGCVVEANLNKETIIRKLVSMTDWVSTQHVETILVLH